MNGGGSALETPTLNGRAGSSLGGGMGRGGGGGAALETPPHLEWKGCILIANCHHPPPMQGTMHAGALGRVDGGGGAALEDPPHLEWKVCILIGEGVRGRGGEAFETPPHPEWKGCSLIVNRHHSSPPSAGCHACR